MSDEEIELFEDVLMCFKRMSNFLSDTAMEETSKYIERFETHLKMIQDKKEKENKKRQEDLIKIMREQTELIKKQIKDSEKMRKLIDEIPKVTDFWFKNGNECPYKNGE